MAQARDLPRQRAGPVAAVQLEREHQVPAVAAGAGRARQAEDEAVADLPRESAGLPGGGWGGGKPVPPVEIMRSPSGWVAQLVTCFWIASILSATMASPASVCPAAVSRSTSRA